MDTNTDTTSYTYVDENTDTIVVINADTNTEMNRAGKKASKQAAALCKCISKYRYKCI